MAFRDRIKTTTNFSQKGPSPMKRFKLERDHSESSSQEIEKADLLTSAQVFKILGRTCKIQNTMRPDRGDYFSFIAVNEKDEVVLLNTYHQMWHEIDEMNKEYHISFIKEFGWPLRLLTTDGTDDEVKSFNTTPQTKIEKIEGEPTVMFSLPKKYQLELSSMEKFAPRSKETDFVYVCFVAKVIKDVGPPIFVGQPGNQFKLKSYLIEDDGMTSVTLSSKGETASTFKLNLGETYDFYFIRLTRSDYVYHGFELTENRFTDIRESERLVGNTHVETVKDFVGQVVYTNTWKRNFYCYRPMCKSDQVELQGKLLRCLACGNRSVAMRAHSSFTCNVGVEDTTDGKLYDLDIPEKQLVGLFGKDYGNMPSMPLELIAEKHFWFQIDPNGTEVFKMDEYISNQSPDPNTSLNTNPDLSPDPNRDLNMTVDVNPDSDPDSNP